VPARKCPQKLLPLQRSDFAGLFKSMDGFPVVIRTLDPPLPEFVPKREDLMVLSRRNLSKPASPAPTAHQ
jgi:pyruvate,orthophosphate dikinase